ncbi:MAG: hypothetical protein IT337_12445 [Thermomicrobiales bacterium]|nr:hypothetical protein [Thermomicrobiales bacterium]
MQQALALLATRGMTQRDAARKAGISEFHLSRELRKPQIQAFIARKARESISVGALRASARVLELLDAASEHVSLDASKHVLAIEGIRPPDQSQPLVNIAISPGYVIDLSGGSHVADQRDDGAKPLIEHGPVGHADPEPDR